ncbi:hypothetical protein N7510_007300 [Penicillium lagena]|uniref:uncharacterized protein n=1 Tax=Penicillium lagena TaxID=94218 RepID=UPI002542570A|nr:uncharacterized protein N7510_007300 [Penicillium lagena]KAJ5610581.1 hypothetical protein N7510_007300 [Penicillium lagena]
MATPDGPHRLPELKAALEEAASARGAAYHTMQAVVFYFESDDTAAKDDVETLAKWCFQDVFDIQTTVIKLATTDKMPGFTLTKRLNVILEQMDASSRSFPSLLILAYVGHAMPEAANGQVKLVAGPGRQNIQWSFIREQYFSPFSYLTANVDTLGVLDCCYAGANRAKTDRTCQVLSACGPNEIARSRTGGMISFTQRFYRAARNLSKTGKAFATVEELVTEVNREKPSAAPAAQLTFHGGVRPIAIPFKGTSSASAQQGLRNLTLSSPEATSASVLVKLSIAGPPVQILEQFKGVITSLPAQFGVEIIDAYESNSVVLLLRMSRPTYLRLSSTIDFHFIENIVGPSLVRSGAPSLPILMAKENIRPAPGPGPSPKK